MTTAFPFQKTVALNELPAWSAWPARLLSLAEWNAVQRTTEKIEQEYNREKYAACLKFLEQNPSASPEDLKQFEVGEAWGKETCVSRGEELYATTFAEAWQYSNECLRELLAPIMSSVDIICDLGCGYGYHLALLKKHFPKKRYFGGEFSSNAVSLAKKLFPNDPNLTVEQLDLSDVNFTLPFSKKENVLIITGYAIDSLPSGKATLQRLATLKGESWHVCHFEPVYEWCSQSMLGLLRRAYTRANDYNRDLLPALEGDTRIHIERVEKNFIGLNPLHPHSFIHWK